MHAAEATQGLVLAGHGSHLSADSAAPVYEHAARIRALGIFDEVVETFWKEEPSLRDALDLVESDDIFIVPLFLSEGYFTRVVLPRELNRGHRPGQVVHNTAPVGAHPAMAGLVLRRAIDVDGFGEADRAAATLIVIGHGTERTRGSGSTTYRVRDELRTMGVFAAVECGFLDEAPGLPEVLGRVQTPDVVLVPFFMSAGWHAGTTLPRDLGLARARGRHGGRRLAYTPPVGTLADIADIAIQLAVDAGAHDRRGVHV
ncbi:MAG: CbiX/SirB N-terminal domain-containing protein [Gemmatimonadota bacterium]